jgi:hypothetical protein
VDYSNASVIVYMLMAVHIASFYISRYMIGTKKFVTYSERINFSKRFTQLTIILLAMNIPVAAIAISKVVNHRNTMGNYF